MSAPHVLVDHAIGETRTATMVDGAVVELHVARWSAANTKARFGANYCARVCSVDRARRGAFLEAGGVSLFLPLNMQARAGIAEGAKHIVRVVRETARGKDAVVEWVRAPAPGDDIGLVAAPLEPTHAATLDDDAVRIDEWIDQALSRTAPIPGGGVLTIEPTQALVAIDVDAAGRRGADDGEAFALSLNEAAAREAMRHVRLRALGGIVAVDFVSMRHEKSRAAVQAALRAAGKGDPCALSFERMSRFGVVEFTRAQRFTPLHEVMCDEAGALSDESVALRALRALEREARLPGGRMVKAHVHPRVFAWLQANHIEWRAALNARIGARWSFIESPRADHTQIDMEAS
jgi:Ribonuclease G/E